LYKPFAATVSQAYPYRFAPRAAPRKAMQTYTKFSEHALVSAEYLARVALQSFRIAPHSLQFHPMLLPQKIISRRQSGRQHTNQQAAHLIRIWFNVEAFIKEKCRNIHYREMHA